MTNTKALRRSALACLIFTVLWLVLMILSVIKTGSINTFEEAIGFAAERGSIYRLSYINAVFVTIAVTVFFVSLYRYCRRFDDHWSLAGLVFVPVYCALNLVVYFSQLTVVPRLVELVELSGHPGVYQVLLGQFVQNWPGSAVSVLNQLAYAVLGISSIIFGVMLIKGREAAQLGGWLLGLNGLACIAGAAGTAAGSQAIATGSVVGGALFLFALCDISVKMNG